MIMYVRILLFLVFLSPAVLFGQTVQVNNSGPSPEMLNGLSAKEAVSLANEWALSGNGVTSFVTTESVNFSFPDGQEVSIPLPEDKFLVAVAPYVRKTHPCGVHYMSSCQGELIDVPVRVRVKAADGDIIIDDTYYTLQNGFFELWLPRDLSLKIVLEAQGLKADGEITTHEDSKTCITTYKLN
jgi:hypothetical protein